MADISKTSRMAIRKLARLLKYYTDHEYCDKDCTCEVCRALRYAKREDKKLTYIIKTNYRVRHLYDR